MTQPLTLEAIYGPEASWEGVSLSKLQWREDGTSFVYLDPEEEAGAKSIFEHPVSEKRPHVVVKAASLVYEGKPVLVQEFEMSGLVQRFLLAGPPRPSHFRYGAPSPERDFFLYDVEDSILRPLSPAAGPQRYAQLSPDGRRAAFVRNDNLFCVDCETGRETQLTTDGGQGIVNGENRGYGSRGWCWSPDGERILFVRVDERDVKSIPLVDYLPSYPKIHWRKYPKAGEVNWRFRVGLIDIVNGQIQWLGLGSEEDVYYPRLHWAPDGREVFVQRLNRRQNHLELWRAGSQTGQAELLLTEDDERWVRADDDLIVLEKTPQFVWTSERSGHKHAYLYDRESRCCQALTAGDWELSAARSSRALMGVDEEEGWLYFLGKVDDPTQDHLYRIGMDGTRQQQLTFRPGWHSISLSPDRKHFIDTHSDINTPPRISLHRTDGREVIGLKDGCLAARAAINWSPPQFMTITNRDGVRLSAVMTKPVDFDAQKRYPVIFYAYGGVSSQTVVNRWGGARGVWHQYLTQQGYIVVSVDNQGTGGRGKEFEAKMYKSIGTTPVLDHIDAARQLMTLPYVDSGAGFGIYGVSGGGFLTCLALTRGGELFKTGVAMAAATNYRMYQSCWSERYLGMPDDNPGVYLRESVIPYTGLLQGRLLLVHGMADDNVQLQHTVEVAEALQEEGKQFDLMYYHGREHGIRGENTQWHLYRMIADHFLRHMPPARPHALV